METALDLAAVLPNNIRSSLPGMLPNSLAMFYVQAVKAAVQANDAAVFQKKARDLLSVDHEHVRLIAPVFDRAMTFFAERDFQDTLREIVSNAVHSKANATPKMKKLGILRSQFEIPKSLTNAHDLLLKNASFLERQHIGDLNTMSAENLRRAIDRLSRTNNMPSANFLAAKLREEREKVRQKILPTLSRRISRGANDRRADHDELERILNLYQKHGGNDHARLKSQIASGRKRKANRLAENEAARKEAKRLGLGLLFPSEVKLLDVNAYVRLRLGNGCTVHLIGETHSDYMSACDPASNKFNIDCLLDEFRRLSAQTKKQMDVYLERRGPQTDPKLEWSLRGDPKSLVTLLQKYRRAIPLAPNARPSNRIPFVRVHVGDLRNTIDHPAISRVFQQDLNHNSDPRAKNSNIIRGFKKGMYPAIRERNFYHEGAPGLARRIVTSNAYANNLSKTEIESLRQIASAVHQSKFAKGWNLNRAVANRPPVPRRDSTSYGGKSVSRLRKQILKLGHGLDNAMLRFFELMYPMQYEAASIILTDMYAVARMLHYAGYGKTPVSNRSEVVVWFGGALHVRNQRIMLHALDSMTGGKLKLVEEDSKIKNTANSSHGTMLSLNVFRTGFE